MCYVAREQGTRETMRKKFWPVPRTPVLIAQPHSATARGPRAGARGGAQPREALLAGGAGLMGGESTRGGEGMRGGGGGGGAAAGGRCVAARKRVSASARGHAEGTHAQAVVITPVRATLQRERG